MALADIIGTELKTAAADDIREAVEETTSQLGTYITTPQPESERPVIATEWMALRPKADIAWSFHVRNLIRANPISPQTLGGLVAGTEAYRQGAGYWGAFVAALTALAVRSVKRDEAVTLHLGHRMCLARGTFTLEDMIEAADQLRDEYDVIKNSPSDIENNIKALERAGCIRETYRGYHAEEVVWITPF